jgi:hypothetical protein
MAWADEGEQLVGQAFQGTAVPTIYVGLLLSSASAPTETTTMATLSGECADSGYARLALAANTTDWPTLALDGGDYMLTSKALAFGNAVTQYVVRYYFLTTSASGTGGKFLGWQQLTADKTIAIGNNLAFPTGIRLKVS